MRKRFVINRDAAVIAGIIWFFGWLAVAALDKPNDDTPAPAWVWIVWFAPYVLPVVALLLYGAWRWVRSENGWIVRRVHEPVMEDLRARMR